VGAGKSRVNGSTVVGTYSRKHGVTVERPVLSRQEVLATAYGASPVSLDATRSVLLLSFLILEATKKGSPPGYAHHRSS